MPSIPNYRGIIPAIACPFTADRRIDEPALRRLASWLAGHDGVVAVMTNGHTGEVFSLTPAERAQVTRIVADELRGRLPVISSIVCEGIAEAAEHARAARAAGAAALDVMPPHHWLRFGFTPGHALEYFQAIHEAAPDLDLVCHVYPAWRIEDWLAMAKRLYRLNSAGRIVLDYDLRIAEPFRVPGAESAPDMWRVLAALGNAPALVVRGGNSDILSEATAARMIETLPDAELLTVPGVGHAPTLDEPGVDEAIARLLARAEQEPAGV